MSERIKIDENWTFNEVILNISALKSYFDEVLVLFYCMELHEKVTFLRDTRNKIYALHFDEWKKDRLWEYLNDDIPLETLFTFIK